MLCKRRCAVRSEVHIIGESYRKILFGDRNVSAVLTVDYRYRGTPVSLSGYEPVPEPVCGLELSLTGLLEEGGYGLFAFGHRKTVELTAVHEDSLVVSERKIVVLPFVLSGYDSLYWKSVLACKLEVSLIVCRNGHDDAGTVACEHVVSSPDRDFSSVDRIYRI